MIFYPNRFDLTMCLTAIYACGIELELIIAKSMTIAVGDRLLMYPNTQAH